MKPVAGVIVWVFSFYNIMNKSKIKEVQAELKEIESSIEFEIDSVMSYYICNYPSLTISISCETIMEEFTNGEKRCTALSNNVSVTI